MALKNVTKQHPFDPRIRSLAMPMQKNKSQIQRGYMVQANSLPGYKGKFVFNYLYNPSTIEAMYTVQTSGAPMSYLFPNAGDSGDLAVPINQSVSWTVMFDRTYELNSGAYNSDGTINKAVASTAVPASNGITADPNVYGVWADVVQLQYFTGIMLTGGQAATSSQNGIVTGTSGGTSVNYTARQGFMMMVPCRAFFGSQTNINYYGYISEWDVTYTHFTQYMVPMRCVIDISFQMLPPPTPKGGTSSSGAGFYPTPTGQAPPGKIPWN